MVIGILKIEFHIHENRSLKEKRKIVKSMLNRVKSRFNVSIAEIGANDKWQRIELGITTVGNDRAHIDSSLSSVISFLDRMYLAEIIDYSTEIMNI